MDPSAVSGGRRSKSAFITYSSDRFVSGCKKFRKMSKAGTSLLIGSLEVWSVESSSLSFDFTADVMEDAAEVKVRDIDVSGGVGESNSPMSNSRDAICR